MLQFTVLMVSGKIQDSGGPGWCWALLFACMSGLAFGNPGALGIAITAGYA